MNYSIQYKNARGVTSRTELLPFETDFAAIDHGRASSMRDAIVEIRRGDHLVARLFGLDTSSATMPRPSL